MVAKPNEFLGVTKERFLTLYQNSISAKEIAKKLEWKIPHVYRAFDKWDLEIPGRKLKHISKEELEQTYLNMGMSGAAAYYNVRQRVFSYTLKKLNIKTKKDLKKEEKQYKIEFKQYLIKSYTDSVIRNYIPSGTLIPGRKVL